MLSRIFIMFFGGATGTVGGVGSGSDDDDYAAWVAAF